MYTRYPVSGRQGCLQILTRGPWALTLCLITQITNDKSNYIVICEMHQISPKRTHFEFCKVEGTPCMFYKCHRVPIFTPSDSTASHFRVIRHFDTSPPNDSKFSWNNKRSKVPHIHVTKNQSQTFTPFRSKNIRFRITGHFETSELNWVRMTLHAKRSKVLHVKGCGFESSVMLTVFFLAFLAK